jgi:hypothetical protein
VTRKLVSVSILFFVVAYAILSFFSYNSYFCAAERTGHNHALTTARLALALTVWNFVAGWCGSLAFASGKKHSFNGLTAVVLTLSTAIAGVGFISLPFWIYRGYGVFWFENTWADVSCFFTEGYALGFAILVAPALALITLICEWLVLKTPSRKKDKFLEKHGR